MQTRKLIYNAMINRAPLISILGGPDRIIEASALGNPSLQGFEGVPPRPFLTYRLHTGFPVGKKHGMGRREYCQVWANDDPGDYLRIDEALEEVRLAVTGIPSQDNFIMAEWIETGVDLKDDVMGTINRYIRFQLTGTLRMEEA